MPKPEEEGDNDDLQHAGVRHGLGLKLLGKMFTMVSMNEGASFAS